MTTLYTQIVNNILEMIEADGIGFGDKLPSERSLAERFSASRASVREAIRSLANRGILASRRGDGTYVAMPEQRLIGTSLTKNFQGQVSSKEIFELRYILEPQIAALAAINATPDQVRDLKIMAFDMSHSAAASNTDVTKMDMKFHLAIAECSGNGLLVRLVDSLGDILALSRTGKQVQAERVKMVAKAHFKIVETIADGDAKGAMEAMKQHIQFIEVKFHDKEEFQDVPDKK